MQINNESKLKKFFKRYGVLSVACVCTVAIALTVALCLPGEGNDKVDEEPVGTVPISFVSPMSQAVVTKDYADDRLQLNDSLNRWEIHLGIDLSSENENVFSVCDGVVSSVDSNSLEGYVVEIEHADGFVSIYSSLSENVKVKVGDKVVKGQQIGEASRSATNESVDGSHLHFVLLKDEVEVDPNNYLDLQNK